MNGLSFVKILLRNSAFLKIENKDNYCSLWSILADLYPCNNNLFNRLSNYKQCFNELNIQGSAFTNGFTCSDAHIFNELNKLSINMFELNFYQDQNKCRHKPVPIEVSIIKLDRVIDLIIYKSHHALIEKLNVILGDHQKIFIC